MKISKRERERKIIMNKKKRMLSLLTSVTMAASAFSAFVIPASAEELFREDFEGDTNIFDVNTECTDKTNVPKGASVLASGLQSYGKVLNINGADGGEDASITGVIDTDAVTEGDQPAEIIEGESISVDFDAFMGWDITAKNTIVTIYNTDGEALTSFTYDSNACAVTDVSVDGSTVSGFSQLGIQSYATGASRGANGWDNSKNQAYSDGTEYNPHVTITVDGDGSVAVKFVLPTNGAGGPIDQTYTGTIAGDKKLDVASIGVTSGIVTADRSFAMDNIVITKGTDDNETDEPTDPSVDPIENEVYIDENFDNYETGTIIASVGSTVENDPDPVTKGDIIYAAGRRNNGPINNSASISSDGKLSVVSDSYATGGRGISFTFADTAEIPNVSELASDSVLEMSMDVLATNSFTITGVGDITTDDLTTTEKTVHLRVILDGTANQQYVIVLDSEGNILSSRNAELSASTFTGVSFFIGTGSYTIDNLKVESKAKDVGMVSFTATDSSSVPLEGVSITIGGMTIVTGAEGIASSVLPNGKYEVTAAKSGYEYTSGKGDNYTTTVTVNSDSESYSFALSLMEYIKLPDTVTIENGQTFIAAPKTAEPNTTAAFTVSVLDQYGIPMTPDEYGVTWSIISQETGEENENVTMGQDGVVSVAQSFSTDDGIEAFDVIVVAATDDRNQRVTKTIYVGNNDVIYYEPVNWSVAAGSRVDSMNFDKAVELADVSSISVALKFQRFGNYTDNSRRFVLVSPEGSFVGVQLTSLAGELKAFTGYTGTANMNDSSDTDAFTNSAVLDESYEYDTEIEITFVIDKVNKSVTVSSGDVSVALPLTVVPSSITGMASGLYRYNCAFDVSTVMIQEPDNNYLAISGDVDFAKVDGHTVERSYALTQSVIVPGEEFDWSVAKSDSSATLSETVDGESTVTLVPTESGNATIIKASYNDEVLDSVIIGDTIEVTEGESVTVNANAGEKVMLWNSVEGMKPMSEAVEAASDSPVTIDNNGVLRVNDEAEPGDYTITVISKSNAEKTAKLDVEIGDFQELVSVAVEGSRAFTQSGQTDTYEITYASDEYGDDISNMLDNIAWSSSNTDVATIDQASGKITAVAPGTTEITAAITNGTAVTTQKFDVIISTFSLTGDASGEATIVDTSMLIKTDDVTSYLVTTADEEGNEVSSVEVSVSEIIDGSYTVNTAGAAKYEIAPIFSFEAGSTVEYGTPVGAFQVAVPADTYNFVVTANGERSDVYANDQLIVNNILQGGNAVKSLAVNDIVISENYIDITTADYGRGYTYLNSNTSFTLVKSPSIVNRVRKMYVLGDSLVCIYYNGGDASNNAQTGWGQVLQNYMTDDIEVVDLGNSGVTANGLYGTAFTQVLQSAKPGDIMVLESGYNDRTYDSEDVMKNALRSMYNEAKEIGVEVVFVSPNASQHDYSGDVVWTTRMEAVVAELNVPYIDLSQISYDFLYSNYGTTFVNDDRVLTDTSRIYNVSDMLHSTYHGAQKWASVVAQGLYDLGYDSIIDTSYTYTFTDGLSKTIECKVNAN